MTWNILPRPALSFPFSGSAPCLTRAWQSCPPWACLHPASSLPHTAADKRILQRLPLGKPTCKSSSLPGLFICLLVRLWFSDRSPVIFAQPMQPEAHSRLTLPTKTRRVYCPLPGASLPLPEGFDKSPTVKEYLLDAGSDTPVLGGSSNRSKLHFRH